RLEITLYDTVSLRLVVVLAIKSLFCSFFFFNTTATTQIYTLSLHDALPISTSRQNTKDQVYAQNEMLAYQQKESTARVASIMENTNLSKQQQVSEIMRQMLTQAQTAGQYFTNDQIKEMTRK